MDRVVDRTVVRLPPGRDCVHLVGPGALERLAEAWPAGAGRAFVISDSRVARRHRGPLAGRLMAAGIRVDRLTFPEGEASKTRNVAARLQDKMVAAGVGRSDVVVGLGGGVSTDLAGFAASTLLRGLRWVAVPTSLVGMVDAALGGKTGVDTRLGKNLVGTFHGPEAVVVDPDFLATLWPEAMRDGLAEVVKAGVVSDPGLLEALASEAGTLAIGRPPSPALIERAVAAKLRVVAADPLEAGLRRVLNFGHTVGHAIEAASGYTVSHGEAVAAGMAIEAAVAVRVLGFPAGEAARLEILLARLGLPFRTPVPFAAALPFLRRDKKRSGGAGDALPFALPRRIGVMEDAGGRYAVDVDAAVVEACWRPA